MLVSPPILNNHVLENNMFQDSLQGVYYTPYKYNVRRVLVFVQKSPKDDAKKTSERL